MTQEQFERWRQFTLGMSLRGFASMTDARRNRLHEEIETWFSAIDDDYAHIISWDHSEPFTDERTYAYYVCDYVSEFFDRFQQDEDYACDHQKFYDQIECCLRAGLDVAATPSAGVLGFSVGDVTRIFEGNVPDWFSSQFKGWDETNKEAGVWL